jgi:AraC-like DNA-binding protein
MLAAQLVRNYDAGSRPRDDPVRRLDPAALRSVMGYMHDHVAEHIALDELSRVAGASRFRFLRLFRASTGMTPMKYLESCRIELARKLLREGNRSMAEIAIAVGFADQSHFVKRFRRHTGCTPGQYAAQIGGWKFRERLLEALRADIPPAANLRELAAIAGLSRFHFSRQFKLAFGVTPMQFLENERVSRAKAMIREGKLRFSDIAMVLGYSEHSHFTRRFKANTGLTPTEFARAGRQGDDTL